MVETVSFIDMTAKRTGPGSVSGVNRNYRNPGHLGFVFDKRPQLREAPGMLSASLGLSNSYPVSDAFQIFQGNSLSGALGLRNQLLGDLMINVSGESLFFGGSLLQDTFGRFSSFGLQSGPQSGITMPQAVDLTAGEDFTVRINGKICDPKIHSQKTFRVKRFMIGEDAVLQQEELTVPVNQVGLAFNPAQLLFSVSATNKGHNLSALQGGNGNPVHAFVGQQPVVQDHGAMGLKAVVFFLIAAVGFGHLADSTHRHLRREIKLFSQVVITSLLNTVFRGGFKFKGYIGRRIAGCIKCLHGFEQKIGLFRRCQELDFQDQVHNKNYTPIDIICQYKMLKPSPEGEGFWTPRGGQ